MKTTLKYARNCRSYWFPTGVLCVKAVDFSVVVEEILWAECDLILLDLRLPYYNGYYVCSHVRNKSNVPIIVVTSKNTEFDELMSLISDADDFVTKSFNAEILNSHINAVLKRSSKNYAAPVLK